MATFASKTFKSANYNAFRPRYPASFYKVLSEYHHGDKKLLLDTGCGTGVATFPLLDTFDKVIGTDSSAKMIEVAQQRRSDLDHASQSRIEFHVTRAEELGFVKSNSVDMITAAQCIHWYNHDVFFKEAHRILRPGGTLAYWYYVDPVIMGSARANKILDKYIYDDPRYMGPKWETGRKYIRDYLREVIPPAEFFGDHVIDRFVASSDYGNRTTPLLIADKNGNLKALENYLKTYSSYHTWKEANPDEPDAADLAIDELKSELGWNSDTIFDFVWNTGYTFVRKL